MNNGKSPHNEVNDFMNWERDSRMTIVKGSTLHVYLLAGVRTPTCTFNHCKKKLDERLRSDGLEPIIHVLFPYGDASRNVLRQVLEVKSDLSNRISARRIGGRHVLNQIKKTFRGNRMLMIGHSGGGVAAYQAARMVEEHGIAEDFRIVQVGSPRRSRSKRDRKSSKRSNVMRSPATPHSLGDSLQSRSRKKRM